MIDELLSLRAILVSRLPSDRDLFAEALASAPIPVELATADSAASLNGCLRGGADVLYLDGGLPAAEIARMLGAVRAVRDPPFTVLLTESEDGVRFETDALAGKPARLDQAKRLTECSIRVRLPTRVLIVDDSKTMRSIVHKLLAGTRFPLEVSEVDEGFAALKLVRENPIDLVFMDYNMPGFSGLETIAELKREKRRVHVVLMTSQPDESLSERAHEIGAGFLKKPFYPADIEGTLCRYYGLRALNPARA
jgi:CheY-like chemotaxis protein